MWAIYWIGYPLCFIFLFWALLFIRDCVVFDVRMWVKVRIKQNGTKYAEAYEKYTHKQMMWMLHKWTVEQFYPELFKRE